MSIALHPVSRAPWVTSWGRDEWSFNLPGDSDDEEEGNPDSDGSGLPGREIVGRAVAFWTASHPHADVAMVARVFNLPPGLAADASSPDAFVAAVFSDALMVWSSCVGASVPIDLAAAVFDVPVSRILAIVDDHPWMFVERLDDVSCIGHDGE